MSTDDGPDGIVRRRMIVNTLGVLAYGYHVVQIATLTDGVEWIIARRRDKKWWVLTDNGGEFNLSPINDDTVYESIPYTWFGAVLDGGTMAYRIVQQMDGDEIDWDRREPEIEVDMCEKVAAGCDLLGIR